VFASDDGGHFRLALTPVSLGADNGTFTYTLAGLTTSDAVAEAEYGEVSPVRKGMYYTRHGTGEDCCRCMFEEGKTKKGKCRDMTLNKATMQFTAAEEET
jgi:hypothetical protein